MDSVLVPVSESRPGPGPRRRGKDGARIGLMLGPAFIAAVAYVDPGNFATNIQGGARFGYELVWVVVAANLAAMVVQVLAAKLGLVTGASLPELIRDHARRPLVIAAWLGAELVAMATDLAELLGAALGLQLLLGVSLLPATVICAAATFAVLILQQRGMPLFEALIAALVGVIALCYLAETIMGKPDFAAAAGSFLPPQLSGGESILLASGILGATVMPHIIYLHSSLMTDRFENHGGSRIRQLLRLQARDIVIALGVAGIVNTLMLMLAAATFHANGLADVASIPTAYRTLTPILGPAAGTIFAISLMASGLSASAVGTLAGQVVMKGFLHRSIPIWLRRSITMLPALVVAAAGLPPTRALVISQVILSFGIPPALIPLAWMTRSSAVMGKLQNGPLLTFASWALVVLISGLNVYLLAVTL